MLVVMGHHRRRHAGSQHLFQKRRLGGASTLDRHIHAGGFESTLGP